MRVSWSSWGVSAKGLDDFILWHERLRGGPVRAGALRPLSVHDGHQEQVVDARRSGIINAMRSPIAVVDVDRCETWTRYKNGLCDTCAANCCTMPVEVKLADLVRLELVDPFEAEHEDPKQIAKRLSKAGLIEHFNFKNSIFSLARRASGDCQFLDAKTRRCTVYDKRPNTCRLHPQVGPRPNHCPYGNKAQSR
jgi:Fe-S-cluster containining protein